jgi:hypothetical protein
MPKLYEALAEAFLAEGVDTQFVLMGDGNMHWSTAFAKLPGVHTVHVRHEHGTVAAAIEGLKWPTNGERRSIVSRRRPNTRTGRRAW